MPRILLLSIRTCGVITTATICRGNRRPVPILANNLLSCVRAFVRPLLSRIVKKKRKKEESEYHRDLPLRLVVSVLHRFILRYFSFSYLSTAILTDCFANSVT